MQPLSAQAIQQMRDLYNHGHGLTLREIAAQVQCSPSTVSVYLRDCVKPRRSRRYASAAEVRAAARGRHKTDYPCRDGCGARVKNPMHRCRSCYLKQSRPSPCTAASFASASSAAPVPREAGRKETIARVPSRRPVSRRPDAPLSVCAKAPAHHWVITGNTGTCQHCLAVRTYAFF